MFNLTQNPKIVEPDYEGERTLLLIPSISFGDFALKQYQGAQFFEERYLYFLHFLKQPKTRMIVVLSAGMEDSVYAYFLHHVIKATGADAQKISERIIHVQVPGMHQKSLTHSILRHPEYIGKIKSLIDDPDNTYIDFFRVSDEEVQLSNLLDVPYYGLSPNAFYVNSKSGSKKLFRETGVATPTGYEDLYSLKEIFDAQGLLFANGKVKKVVAKVNDAGSGLGFIFTDREEMPTDFDAFVIHVHEQLQDTYDLVIDAIETMGAIAEEFIQANEVISPSAQFEIKPDGVVVNLATHDQILNGVEYVGVNFPAHESYRSRIIEQGYTIAKVAAQKGAHGIFAIDFLLTRDIRDVPYDIYAIEINARKGGTNHTYMWAKYLTSAVYNETRGIFECDKGDVYYQGSELFMKHDWLKRIEFSVFLSSIKTAGLDFDHEKKTGVIIHLLSTLPDFGKFGCTIVGHSREEVGNLCTQLEKTILSLKI